MSVKSHLTYGASVRPENAVTYSAGNEGQKICGVFSETAPLQRSSTPSVVRPCVQSAIFPCVFSCTRMRISRVYTRMIHRRGFSTLVLFTSIAMHDATVSVVRALRAIYSRGVWLRMRCVPDMLPHSGIR